MLERLRSWAGVLGDEAHFRSAYKMPGDIYRSPRNRDRLSRRPSLHPSSRVSSHSPLAMAASVSSSRCDHRPAGRHLDFAVVAICHPRRGGRGLSPSAPSAVLVTPGRRLDRGLCRTHPLACARRTRQVPNGRMDWRSGLYPHGVADTACVWIEKTTAFRRFPDVCTADDESVTRPECLPRDSRQVRFDRRRASTSLRPLEAHVSKWRSASAAWGHARARQLALKSRIE
jgi:hypothetical protein